MTSILENVNWEVKKNTVTELKEAEAKGSLNLQPIYQRGFVWGPLAQKRFIGQVLSVPTVIRGILNKRLDTLEPRYDTIDGKNKLKALFDFLDDKFKVELPGNTELDKKQFSELPVALQTSIRNKSIRFDVVSVEDKTAALIYNAVNSAQSKMEVFDRIWAEGMGVYRDAVEQWADRANMLEHKLLKGGKMAVAKRKPEQLLSEVAWSLQCADKEKGENTPQPKQYNHLLKPFLNNKEQFRNRAEVERRLFAAYDTLTRISSSFKDHRVLADYDIMYYILTALDVVYFRGKTFKEKKFTEMCGKLATMLEQTRKHYDREGTRSETAAKIYSYWVSNRDRQENRIQARNAFVEFFNRFAA